MCYVPPCPNCRSPGYDEPAAKETEQTTMSIKSDEPAAAQTGQTTDDVPPEKLLPQKQAVSIVSDEPATTQMGQTADTVAPETVQPQHPDEVEATDSHSVQVNR